MLDPYLKPLVQAVQDVVRRDVPVALRRMFEARGELRHPVAMPEQLRSATAELLSGNRPKQFSGLGLADFREKTNNKAALAVVRTYLEDLPHRVAEGRGLCLIGPPQQGKTLLATVVLNAYMKGFEAESPAKRQEMRRRMGAGGQSRPGFPIYFITLSQYVRAHLRKFDLRAAWEKVPDTGDEYAEYKEWDVVLTSLRDRVDLLVVDDVGKEHKTGSGFAEDEFDYLIRQRQHHQLPTIFTSNLDLEEWSEQYHESVRPFIRRTCDIAIIERPAATRRRSARRDA